MTIIGRLRPRSPAKEQVEELIQDLDAILDDYAERLEAESTKETKAGDGIPDDLTGEEAEAIAANHLGLDPPSPGPTDANEIDLIGEELKQLYKYRKRDGVSFAEAHAADGQKAIGRLRSRLAAPRVSVTRTLLVKDERGGTIVNPGETITFGPVVLQWDGEGLACVGISNV